MKRTVLFLHGFFASGSCPMAIALKEALEDEERILTPDLPLHPEDALFAIRAIIDQEHPDLIVGNSCGAFYAQMLSPIVGIPALLGNPHFEMSEFLSTRLGKQYYKASRKDGREEFLVNEALIKEFYKLQTEQFDCCNPYYRNRIWGLFGTNDTLAHYEDVFTKHYSKVFHFPGAHTPTPEEVIEYYVPLIKEMIDCFPQKDERLFQHFKGGHYRYIQSAFDSETRERVVVYQALYGEKAYWVRRERMFFENVTRDGSTFSRFTEVDNFET